MVQDPVKHAHTPWEVLPGFLPCGSRAALLEIRDDLQRRFPQAWATNTYKRFCLRGEKNAALLELRGRAQEVLGPECATAPWDSFLLVFPDGSCCPPHVDPPEMQAHLDRQHLRLNILLKGAVSGGELFILGEHVEFFQGDACLFRPGTHTHEVRKVQGERLVLSFGVWKL